MPTRAFIPYTPGSGGKHGAAQYTDGADTKLDSVMVLGEQYLASYIANSGAVAVSAATTNAHIFQIMAGATNKVRIRRVEVYQVAMATAVSVAALALVRLTTAGTGGTVITPAPLETADGASGATCMTLPTVKGTEANVVANAEVYLMQTLAVSNQFNEPIMVFDFDRPRSKPLVLAAGVATGIALKNLNGVAAATLLFNVWFDESPY